MQSVLFGVHEMHKTGTGVEGDCPINTKDTKDMKITKTTKTSFSNTSAAKRHWRFEEVVFVPFVPFVSIGAATEVSGRYGGMPWLYGSKRLCGQFGLGGVLVPSRRTGSVRSAKMRYPTSPGWNPSDA
jgi:hypothetical protein